MLFRTNGQSEAYEQALASAGIGYQLRGGERFFARKEFGTPSCSCAGPHAETEQARSADLVRDVLLGAGWTRRGPAQRGRGPERWESLAALVALADELVISDRPRGPGCRTSSTSSRNAPRPSTRRPSQGVTLASLHAAKGLEWDAVFLVGLSEGLLPISLADTPEAVDEERRLLYVGVTRARERLFLSWSTARTPRAPSRRGAPSRFLDGPASVLGGQLASSAAAGGTAPEGAVPASCRVVRRPCSPRRGRDRGALQPVPRPVGGTDSSTRCGNGARTWPRRRTSRPSSSSPTPP